MTTLLFFAQNSANNDVYFLWGCILFGVALALLCLEFVVPSGGLIGLLCATAGIGSVVAFYQYDATWGVCVGIAYVLLTPVLLVFIFKLWLHSPVAKVMILGGPGDLESTIEEEGIASEQERQKRLAELNGLVGVQGTTETALRPVGTVRIQGQRIDAMAESGIIEADTPIIVTEVYDNQIKVRKL